MSAPSLSVIVPSPRGVSGARRTLGALARQRIAQEIEVLVVQPLAAAASAGEEFRGRFAALRTVVVAAGLPACHAYAAGVHAASARAVVLGEEHSFPEPGWAEALLGALARGHAAVGPAVRNANPVNGVSWADFWIGFGPWAEPAQAGEAELLPGHNSAYRRDLLLALGEELEGALVSEAVLHWRLRAEGHSLWLEPGAVTAHANFAQLGVFARVQPLNGRVFAAARCASWSRARRLSWAAAWPLIAVVRTARTLRRAAPDLRRAHWTAPLCVALGLWLDAAGQAAGYFLGAGESAEHLHDYEHARERFAGMALDA